MKNFESFLSPQFNEYLAYRQAMGYVVKHSKSNLFTFDRYLLDKEAVWDSLTPSFFLQMRADLSMEPVSINSVLLTLRVFFRFLLRRGYMEKSPIQDIPLLKENITVPFVFSPEQTGQLITAWNKRMRRTERFFLMDFAIYLALLLLARCGLRISEPLRLLRHHYRRDDCTIYIEKTKFKKDRLLPVPKLVAHEINNYLSVREHLKPDDRNPYLLVNKNQLPLKDYQVRSAFHQAVKDIGLDQQKKVVGNMNFLQPSPHSLRHSFAINILREIIERGESAQAALPVLSAYLGHKKYHYSTVYLKVADAQSRNDLLDFTMWQEWKKI
jgi:site-specific recombinase XerD